MLYARTFFYRVRARAPWWSPILTVAVAPILTARLLLPRRAFLPTCRHGYQGACPGNGGGSFPPLAPGVTRPSPPAAAAAAGIPTALGPPRPHHATRPTFPAAAFWKQNGEVSSLAEVCADFSSKQWKPIACHCCHGVGWWGNLTCDEWWCHCTMF